MSDINVGAISEALNNKVDLDAANLSGGGKALISSLGMPGSRVVELTMGASGSTYIAPANGYIVYIHTTNPGNTYVELKNNSVYSSGGFSGQWYDIGYANVTSYMPVKKGDEAIISYNQGTPLRLLFVYAKGDE